MTEQEKIEKILYHTFQDDTYDVKEAVQLILSARDKFAVEFVNWIFEQGYFLNNPLDELLDLYKQSLTSKPQEK